MVALLGFLQHRQVLIEHLLLGEGDPVETRELLALLVTAPVGTSYAQQLDRLDIARIRHVRATAQVREVALRISRDRPVGEVCDELQLVLVTLLFEELRHLSLRDVAADDRLLAGSELRHLSLYGCEVGVAKLHAFAQVNIVVEAILNGRTDTELHTRIERLKGFGHKVRTGVPVGVLPFGIFPLIELQLGVLLEGTHEVPDLAIDTSGQHILLQAGADAASYIPRGRTHRVLTLTAVRERDFYY